MGSTDSDLPYTPPSSSSERAPEAWNGEPGTRDSMRLAGFFLLATSAVEALLWVIQMTWGWTISWPWVAVKLVQASLGACLFRFGQRVAWAALAFVLLTVAYPVVLAVHTLIVGEAAAQIGLLGVAAVLGGPTFFGALRAFPLLLLVTGAQTPRRRNAAAMSFVAWLLLFVSARGLTIYAFQYTASR